MSALSLTLQAGVFSTWVLSSDLANGWRNSHACGLKYVTADSLALSADGEPAALFLEGNLLRGSEVPLDVRPLEAIAGGFDTPVNFLFEDQRKKAAKHVTTYGLIAFVEDRSGLKERLGVSKEVLHLPEFLILEGHFMSYFSDLSIA